MAEWIDLHHSMWEPFNAICWKNVCEIGLARARAHTHPASSMVAAEEWSDGEPEETQYNMSVCLSVYLSIWVCECVSAAIACGRQYVNGVVMVVQSHTPIWWEQLKHVLRLCAAACCCQLKRPTLIIAVLLRSHALRRAHSIPFGTWIYIKTNQENFTSASYLRANELWVDLLYMYTPSTSLNCRRENETSIVWDGEQRRANQCWMQDAFSI